MKTNKTNLFYITSIVLGLIVICFSSFVLIKRSSTSYLTINEIFSSKSIYYQKNYYTLKENVTTYLLMGIDDDGGQADALFLLVADNENEKLFLIPINRNIMADIKSFNYEGKYLGIQKRQICLAHSAVYNYYDPEVATVEAVSKLLFDVPINYYVALDMDGIQYISAVVGDVSVTVNETVSGSNLIQGETITIDSTNIFDYLHVRDKSKIGGAEKRLERETTFLLACYNKYKNPLNTFSVIKNTLSSNDDIYYEFTSKYEKISSFVRTNIDNPVSNVLKYLKYDFSEQNIYFVPHKTQLDENSIYEVCYLDTNKTKEILLNIFYNKTLY